MKKTLALFLFLPVFAVACTTVEAPAVDETETTSTIPEVKHYTGRFVSFDYPSDLSLYVVQEGEGGAADTVVFMSWDEAQGAYMPAGPGLRFQEYWGSDGAMEQFAADRREAQTQDSYTEVTLGGAEAFQVNSGAGICDSWDIVTMLFPYGDTKAMGIFSANGACAGTRYQEVLDQFLASVTFND